MNYPQHIMKMTPKFFLLPILSLLLFFTTSSQANFYIRPHVGAAIGFNNGDAAYSLGVTGGYAITNFLSTDLTYARFLNITGDLEGDTFRGSLTVTAPTGILTPYASIGAGFIRYDLPDPFGTETQFMVPIGGGLRLIKIALVSVSVGAQYLIINERDNLVEPYVNLGLHF